VSSYGKFVAGKLLSLPPGSLTFSLTHVFFAFFLSGIVHTSSISDSRPLFFFLLQSVAIMFESAIIAIANRYLPADAKAQKIPFTFFGYVWVWFWFLYSAPPFWDSMIRSGIFDPEKSFVMLYWLQTEVFGT
jgi:hypothetical protein